MKDSLRFGATKVESFNRLNFKQELTNDPKDYNILNLPLFLPLNFCSHDEMRKFRTKRSIERSRGASGVRRGFSLSSSRRGSVGTVILHPGYAVSGRHVGQAED